MTDKVDRKSSEATPPMHCIDRIRKFATSGVRKTVTSTPDTPTRNQKLLYFLLTYGLNARGIVLTADKNIKRVVEGRKFSIKSK